MLSVKKALKDLKEVIISKDNATAVNKTRLFCRTQGLKQKTVHSV